MDLDKTFSTNKRLSSTNDSRRKRLLKIGRKDFQYLNIFKTIRTLNPSEYFPMSSVMIEQSPGKKKIVRLAICNTQVQLANGFFSLSHLVRVYTYTVHSRSFITSFAHCMQLSNVNFNRHRNGVKLSRGRRKKTVCRRCIGIWRNKTSRTASYKRKVNILD